MKTLPHTEKIERRFELFDITMKVLVECYRQIDLWGVQTHSPEKFLSILLEEVGEVAREVNEWLFHEGAPLAPTKKERLEKMKEELIQVAAVAVSMVNALKKRLD